MTADGPAGVLRGLATLRQSIANAPGGFAISAMVIDDAPRFPWRAMMIDAEERFVRGNHSGGAALKPTLASWRYNHDWFAAVVKATRSLRPRSRSPPTSPRARVGLDAVAAIESGHPPDTDWRGRAKELLDRQAAAEKASESTVQVFTTQQQPPADLLISITPGVRSLVESAMSLGR